MLQVLFISGITAFIVSFFMMKVHMRMLEKWMDRFFEEELKRIKDIIVEEHILE